MAIKVLMVDADGVIIAHPHPHGWSLTLEKDLDLARETLQTAFFKRHFADVVHGRAALRDRLAPVLREIAPHLTCDQLIDYWFSNDAHINHDLLDQLAAARIADLSFILLPYRNMNGQIISGENLVSKTTLTPFTMQQIWAGQSLPPRALVQTLNSGKL
jgi:hypothetical protein